MALRTRKGGRRYFYGRSLEAVKAKLEQGRKEDRDGRVPTGRLPTVEQYMTRWLEVTAKPRIRPLTYSGYRVNVENHINPLLGKIRLDRLTADDVESMMTVRLRDGLSGKTVTYMRMVLRNALNDAVRRGLLTRNVVDAVDPPRKVRPPTQPFTPDEARVFLKAIRGNRLEALFSVALALGLRQGEALGLQWKNIDLKKGTLAVRLQQQRIDRKLRLVEPKSEQSRRTLALPPLIVDSFRQHQTRQRAERDRAGSSWKASDHVFTNLDGSPLDARKLIDRYHEALKVAGLPRRRFHDLRHSCATLLLVQGVSPRVVMEVLGHSEIAMTMNTYSHVVPELRREAADRMEAILRKR